MAKLNYFRNKKRKKYFIKRFILHFNECKFKKKFNEFKKDFFFISKLRRIALSIWRTFGNICLFFKIKYFSGINAFCNNV